MPEIEVRCIFDEEDERVLLCQILVPLVPKISKNTDTRCYRSKGNGKRKRMKREKEEGGEKREYGICGLELWERRRRRRGRERRRQRRWKMRERKRVNGGGRRRGGAVKKRMGGGGGRRRMNYE